MLQQLKKLLPHKVKVKHHLKKLKNKPDSFFEFNIPKVNKRIFIFLAADYGNLGDVAITYAQHKFLKTSFPDYTVTEIPISKTLKGLEYVRRIIKEDDIITTVGGGNMGDLYEQIENFRQLTFEYFPNNCTISFPQTADFSNNSIGIKKLKEAKRIYSSHRKLILLAREFKTAAFFKKHFPEVTSLLVPDIVMSLDRTVPSYNRLGGLICLRADKERKLNQQQQDSIVDLVKNEFGRIQYRDTHIGTKEMPLKTRVNELFKIWEDFKKAELVITDRLHGMIFCFITNTPVIVLLNNNHKVETSYEWIKYATNIRLIKQPTVENILNAIAEIKRAPRNTKLDLLPEFDSLLDIIEKTK